MVQQAEFLPWICPAHVWSPEPLMVPWTLWAHYWLSWRLKILFFFLLNVSVMTLPGWKIKEAYSIEFLQLHPELFLKYSSKWYLLFRNMKLHYYIIILGIKLDQSVMSFSTQDFCEKQYKRRLNKYFIYKVIKYN